MNNIDSLRTHLLARHAAADSQLDERRRSTLTLHAADAAPVPFSQLLSALFLPNRRLWSALAAAWVILLALHFFQHPALPAASSARMEFAAGGASSLLNRQAQLHALLR